MPRFSVHRVPESWYWAKRAQVKDTGQRVDSNKRISKDKETILISAIATYYFLCVWFGGGEGCHTRVRSRLCLLSLNLAPKLLKQRNLKTIKIHYCSSSVSIAVRFLWSLLYAFWLQLLSASFVHDCPLYFRYCPLSLSIIVRFLRILLSAFSVHC